MKLELVFFFGLTVIRSESGLARLECPSTCIGANITISCVSNASNLKSLVWLQKGEPINETDPRYRITKFGKNKSNLSMISLNSGTINIGCWEVLKSSEFGASTSCDFYVEPIGQVTYLNYTENFLQMKVFWDKPSCLPEHYYYLIKIYKFQTLIIKKLASKNDSSVTFTDIDVPSCSRDGYNISVTVVHDAFNDNSTSEPAYVNYNRQINIQLNMSHDSVTKKPHILGNCYSIKFKVIFKSWPCPLMFFPKNISNLSSSGVSLTKLKKIEYRIFTASIEICNNDSERWAVEIFVVSKLDMSEVLEIVTCDYGIFDINKDTILLDGGNVNISSCLLLENGTRILDGTGCYSKEGTLLKRDSSIGIFNVNNTALLVVFNITSTSNPAASSLSVWGVLTIGGPLTMTFIISILALICPFLICQRRKKNWVRR